MRTLTGLGLATLTACSVEGAATSTIVTEAVNHQETEGALAGPDLEVAAGDYLWTYNDQLDLGLGSEDVLDVFKVSESGGLRHARLQQIHAGVPVFGADLVVHADDTTFLGFNGYLTRHLEGFDITASLTREAATSAAKDDLSGGITMTYRDESATLVILPGKQEGADLAWHVRFHNLRSGDIDAGIWNYFIDARTGAVLQRFNSLSTLEQGSGPGGSPKKAKTWSSELDVEMKEQYEMDTEKLQTLDGGNGDMVLRSAELDNFMDKEGNNAHGYAEITLNMMSAMGHDSLDDAGFKIVSRVHDTEACGPLNACWDGARMNYGDGGGDVYPFSGSLDVVAHELNHGFTEFHSNLTYEGQSGGLNESFSDIAGTCAEHHYEAAAADFEIGEDISAAGALRYMCDPAQDGSSIGDAGDYQDGMDVHYSSGVGNRAFCLAVARFKTVGEGGADTVRSVALVGSIWYEANSSYWTASTDFAQACQGTLDATRAMGWASEAVQAIADSWADVGVTCDSGVYVCDGDGTCDAADGETCASCAEDCGSCADGCSAFNQAKCADGIGECSACDGPPGCGDGVCDGDETDASCGQDCGCGSFAGACGNLAPFGCYCDPACAENGDCCADVGTCGG